MKLNKRKCTNCKKLFQKIKPLQSACSIDCAREKARKDLAKKKEKEFKQRKKEFKAKDKTYTQKLNEARRVFQKWIRERDKDKPCISCGQKSTKLWDGGHFYKAELYRGLIFDESNCHKQCRKCNRYLGGNESGYVNGLIKRYGQEYYETLKERANDTPRERKYTDEELEQIKIKYKV